MIIFDLSCDNEHVFEGWFQSQEAYEKQLEDGLIACPHCGSVEIRRVPSAVHLGSKAEARPIKLQEPESGKVSVASGTAVLSVLQQLMSAVLTDCEDVGKDFVQEARKMHYLEAPERSIRGEATEDDFEALRDEGIEVFRLPRVKSEDLN